MKRGGPGTFSIERVRKLRKDEQAFAWFLDTICVAVVGQKKAELDRTIHAPTKWLTTGLEAFSLLCLENYFEMVLSQVENDQTVPPKWTADGRGRQRNQGWSVAGIQRYNEIRTSVVADRASAHCAEVETKYLDRRREILEDKLERKLKRKRDRLNEREKGLEDAQDDFCFPPGNEENAPPPTVNARASVLAV